MKKKLKIFWFKIKLRVFSKYIKLEEYSEMLRLEGIEVGKGTVFFSPNSQIIDRQRPWMLKIGSYCKIARGTTILTHDYSRSVLRRVYGDIIGEAGETIIGNNVFIGMNSIILMGSHIGNNVIIGASSVVSGEIPSNTVVAGNPAKVIRTLDEHYAIRKKKYQDEAKLYVTTFFEKYNREPSINEMDSFFPLFLLRSEQAITENKININLNGDDSHEVVDAFLKTKPIFEDYETFLREALAEVNNC